MKHQVIDGVSHFSRDYTTGKHIDAFIAWSLVVLFSVVYASLITKLAFDWLN